MRLIGTVVVVLLLFAAGLGVGLAGTRLARAISPAPAATVTPASSFRPIGVTTSGEGCENAIDRVARGHPVLEPKRAALVPTSWGCGIPLSDGETPVYITWWQNGRQQVATYGVSPSGTVTPIDGNARSIDWEVMAGPPTTR